MGLQPKIRVEVGVVTSMMCAGCYRRFASVSFILSSCRKVFMKMVFVGQQSVEPRALQVSRICRRLG